MKGKWLGDSDPTELIKGKEYEIVGIDEGLDSYGVIDETGEAYCYPMEFFEITEPDPDIPVRKS